MYYEATEEVLKVLFSNNRKMKTLWNSFEDDEKDYIIQECADKMELVIDEKRESDGDF